MNFAKMKFIFVYLFLISSFWAPVSFSMTDEETAACKEVLKKQTDGARREFTSTIIKSSFAGASAAVISFVGGSVTAGAALGSGFLMYYSNDIRNLLAYLRLTHRTSGLELAEYLNKLELEFARQKNKLTKSHKDQLSAAIMEARTLIGYGIRPIYVNDRMYPQSLLNRIEKILNLPTTMSTCDKKQACDELKRHLKTYSDSVHDGIMKAAMQILLLSDNPSTEDSLGSRAAFIFIGEAGVGKTTTVQAMAAALKRPFFRMTLADTSLEQFYGTSSKDPLKGKGGRLGHLAGFFTKHAPGEKALNAIIVIDEVHHAFESSVERKHLLTALLKDLNDENIEKIRENSLGIDIDIRQTTFILVSNKPLPPEFEALASRLTRINFTELSKEQKREIADGKFTSLCKKFRYLPNDDEKIEDEKVIANIIANDASPGARVLLRVLEDYIIHRLASKDGCIQLRCPDFNITKSIIDHGGRVEKN